jgi:hypothetical protein
MTALLLVLAIYLLGVAIVQSRLLLILRRLRQQIIDSGMAISLNSRGYFWTTFLDSVKWPFYLFWHGLKSLLEDLR